MLFFPKDPHNTSTHLNTHLNTHINTPPHTYLTDVVSHDTHIVSSHCVLHIHSHVTIGICVSNSMGADASRGIEQCQGIICGEKHGRRCVARGRRCVVWGSTAYEKGVLTGRLVRKENNTPNTTHKHQTHIHTLCIILYTKCFGQVLGVHPCHTSKLHCQFHLTLFLLPLLFLLLHCRGCIHTANRICGNHQCLVLWGIEVRWDGGSCDGCLRSSKPCSREGGCHRGCLVCMAHPCWRVWFEIGTCTGIQVYNSTTTQQGSAHPEMPPPTCAKALQELQAVCSCVGNKVIASLALRAVGWGNVCIYTRRSDPTPHLAHHTHQKHLLSVYTSNFPQQSLIVVMSPC